MVVLKTVLQGATVAPATSAAYTADFDGWYRIVQRVKSNDPVNPAANGKLSILQTSPLQALGTTTDVWPVCEVFLKRTQEILVNNIGPFGNIVDIFYLEGQA